MKKMSFDFQPVAKQQLIIPVTIQSDKPVTSFQAFVKVPVGWVCTNIVIDPAFKAIDKGMDLESKDNYLGDAVVVEASAYGVDATNPVKVAEVYIEPADAVLTWDTPYCAVNDSLTAKDLTVADTNIFLTVTT